MTWKFLKFIFFTTVYLRQEEDLEDPGFLVYRGFPDILVDPYHPASLCHPVALSPPGTNMLPQH